jgi:hypothetical protein
VIHLAGDRGVHGRVAQERRRDPDDVADARDAGTRRDERDDQPEQVVTVDVERKAAALPTAAVA